MTLAEVSTLALGSFASAILALAWGIAFGPYELFLLVLLLLALALVAELTVAFTTRWTLRNALLGLLAVAGQVALLCLGVWLGRHWIVWHVQWHLSEYQEVVDRQLAYLSREKLHYLREEKPHPDLAYAEARILPEGGTEVVFRFNHHSRYRSLLFVDRYALAPTPSSEGQCPKAFSDKWFLIVPC
jgi:hypothetical protein